jgi:hypothetical protein
MLHNTRAVLLWKKPSNPEHSAVQNPLQPVKSVEFLGFNGCHVGSQVDSFANWQMEEPKRIVSSRTAARRIGISRPAMAKIPTRLAGDGAFRRHLTLFRFGHLRIESHAWR